MTKIDYAALFHIMKTIRALHLLTYNQYRERAVHITRERIKYVWKREHE